ncbi:HupE/UreJ family protein [Luteolibacter marinus]|uniref:HupE/UreJ family protein n=1 Tax=Luteolibacter marinus TaxID=2776705 RepID=UPI001865D5D0|nr:HupE/UreJ family protein [Luteolibacter marinus]
MTAGLAAQIRKWWAIGLWLVLVTGIAEGHAMKQVRAELTAGEGKWDASVWLEAWALYPEDGPKVPPGEPGDPKMAGNDWTATLDAADHEVMRETARQFLTDIFLLTLDNQPLRAEFEFPDYTTEVPTLEETAEGAAVVRVDLTGSLPPGASGPLKLMWNDDEDEPLALELITPRPGKKPRISVIRLAPRDDPFELMVIEPDGRTGESEESTLWGWVVHGFEHILPKGLDHILFILGLFLLQPKFKPLLWQTSAFTVAHSITLGMVVLGVFTAPARLVESMIALSIAYVGIENLWVKELKPWRVAFVFGLGLLHGMGFASVMQELDLPEGSIVEPLVGFNLGVELGQVTVLSLAFAVTFFWLKKPGFQIARKVASALIAVVGLYWTVERLMG